MAHRKTLPLEDRIALLTLAGGLPAVLVAMWWLWWGSASLEVRWTLTAVIVIAWLGCAAFARARVARPIQVLSNLLSALREGDYSVRAAGADANDAMGLALTEINALGTTLQSQRRNAMDASALVRTVMAEIDVAVFAFDAADRVRLVNRGGERLLDRPAEQLLGRSAAALGLDGVLHGDAGRTLDLAFAGGAARWEIRRRSFRQDGRPHQLLVLADVSHALRQEERVAWQRIVRVLGHEINNSLAPIKSIARSLQRVVGHQPRAGSWEQETVSGLAVIESRAGALARFLQAYAQLAQLPPPRLAPVNVATWVNRVAALEKRLTVQVVAGPVRTIRADSDQLDQMLINLVRNAVDAALPCEGAVMIQWSIDGDALTVAVADEGPGLADTANLFVPFFTTKPDGSGIGLPLSRQIAEAHGGALTLINRDDRSGCRALVRLPISSA
jgi:two-component system nitrogen regulation sensor histidine kinase NtrY